MFIHLHKDQANTSNTQAYILIYNYPASQGELETLNTNMNKYGLEISDVILIYEMGVYSLCLDIVNLLWQA